MTVKWLYVKREDYEYNELGIPIARCVVCTTDSGVCTPSRLVEHPSQHDTIGSILSTNVSTHRVIGTPDVR